MFLVLLIFFFLPFAFGFLLLFVWGGFFGCFVCLCGFFSFFSFGFFWGGSCFFFLRRKKRKKSKNLMEFRVALLALCASVEASTCISLL